MVLTALEKDKTYISVAQASTDTEYEDKSASEHIIRQKERLG